MIKFQQRTYIGMHKFLWLLCTALSVAPQVYASSLANSAFDAAERQEWSSALSYAKQQGDPVLLRTITRSSRPIMRSS